MTAISIQVGPPILTALQRREGIIRLEEKASSFGEGVILLYHGTPTLRTFSIPGAADSLEMISAVIEQNRQRDRERIEALEQVVAELQEVIGVGRGALRKISKAQAAGEIRAYFAQHDEQVVYPSDVAEDPNLDYDLVLEAINELEKKGKVSKA